MNVQGDSNDNLGFTDEQKGEAQVEGEQEPEEQEPIEGEKGEFQEGYGIKIDGETVSFVDGRGKEVIIPKKPQRPVVLFGSYVDLWLRNGGQLVGMIDDTSGAEIPGT